MIRQSISTTFTITVGDTWMDQDGVQWVVTSVDGPPRGYIVAERTETKHVQALMVIREWRFVKGAAE